MLLFILTSTFTFGAAALILLLRRPGLIKGWQHGSTSEVITLAAVDHVQVAVIILSILLKYVPGTIGYRNRLTPDSEGKGFSLPELTLQGPIVVLESDIIKFEKAVVDRGSKPSDDSAASPSQINCFFFASFTTPLLLLILSNHACPLRPLGSVNTQNRFEFEDAAFCRDSRAILSSSKAGTLSYTCTFGGSKRGGKRQKRGIESEIMIEVRNDGKTVLRQHLSFLQFLPRNHPPKFVEDGKGNSNQEPLGITSTSETGAETTITIKTKDPMRWAACCGDYNPIHVSKLAAKIFGFPSVIAHGNYAIALAVQGLKESLSADGRSAKHDVAQLLWQQRSRLELEVKFVKPMLLPANLTVRWKESEKGIVGMEIAGKGQTNVVGRVVG